MNNIEKTFRFIKHQLIHRPLLIGLIAVVIIGGVLWYTSQKPKNSIRTSQVTKQNLTETVSASGEVKAENQSELMFSSPGKVAWIGVKEGDVVKKGRALASLDTVLLNTAYQQAAINLRKFEATLDNVHDQVKDNDGDEDFATRDKRTTAETNKDYYYEALKAAQYNLRNATLISPISGTVTSTGGLSVGENVTATSMGTSIIRIIDLKSLMFEATIDEVDFKKINIGQKVEVILDAFPDEKITGEVVYIGREGKKTITGGIVLPVKIKLTSDSDNLVVGLSGDIEFIVDQKDNILTVPREFVKNDGQISYITVRQSDGTISKITITTGLTTITTQEIIGDIKEGQEVVLQNYGEK